MLATVVRCDPPTSAKPGDKAVITADGRLRGWIGGSCSEPLVRREALRALAEGTPRLVKIVPADSAKTSRKRGELTMATTCPSGGALDIFIEPQLPKPLLVVFGESPAAENLVKLAQYTSIRTQLVPQAGLGLRSGPRLQHYAVARTHGEPSQRRREAAAQVTPSGACQKVHTVRTRTYVSGKTATDGLDAFYYPGPGLAC